MVAWRQKQIRNLHWLFLAAAALLTVYMDVYVAGHLLDGDASQILLRGWVMAREKNLFTPDIYLTTEVSFLDASAVAAFFFLFIGDWTLVRIFTMLVLQGWYVLAFLFMCKQSGIRMTQAVYAAGMLLLPVSTPYARIVLYHLYYPHNIANMFWIIGLTTRLFLASKNQRRVGTWLLLGVSWLLAGLEGIRYMMIIGLPMLAYAFFELLYTLKDYQWEDGKLIGEKPFQKTTVYHFLRIMLFACICFLTGYIINQCVILQVYKVYNSSHSWFWPAVQAQNYVQVFLGWLKANGVRDSFSGMVGVRGLSLVACITFFCCMISISLRGWPGKERNTLDKRFARGLYVFALGTTTFIFLFDSVYRMYELYFLPVVALAYPALAQEMSVLRERGAQASRKLLLLIACLCILFQGAYSIYFIRVDKTTLDKWNGIDYYDMDAMDQVRDCVAFMQENGYTHGMIDYWYASVMVEMTDGGLTVVPLESDYSDHALSINKWGTFKSDFRQENLPEKIVVFIKQENCELFEAAFPNLPLLQEGWIFNAYEAGSELIK